MALIQTIIPSDLYHMACKMGRGDAFGYNGWEAIGEHLEQLSDDIGQDVEVDIVGICCDYSMAEGADEWFCEHAQYAAIDPEEWEDMNEEEKIEAIRDYLEENTMVVCCESDMIIWQAF